MKTTFNLRDTAFAGDPSSVRGKESRYINWDRSCGSAAPTFYTHEQMFRGDIAEDAYGWLIESKGLIPRIYEEVPKHLHKFKLVFTHDRELLDHYPEKCKFAPGGGIWLGGSVGKGSIGLHQKDKDISLVASEKLMCPLHLFRHRLAHRLKNSGLVDVYGTATDKWVPIAETVERYRFSIVIENDRFPHRFTEKVLNCFAAGTIPIYIGSPTIHVDFNADGIIQTDPERVLEAIEMATEEFYDSKHEAIKENFELCQQFEVIEDFIWEHYFA